MILNFSKNLLNFLKFFEKIHSKDKNCVHENIIGQKNNKNEVSIKLKRFSFCWDNLFNPIKNYNN